MSIKKQAKVVAIGLCLGLLGFIQPANTIMAQEIIETPQVIQDVEWHPRGEAILVTGRGNQGVWGLWLYNTNLELIRFFQFENPVSADWSPEGTRFSMGRNIVDAQTLDVLVTINATSGIGGWSPDSSQVLAWATEVELGLFNSDTGQLERIISVGESIPDAVSWSPDGRLFAFLQPTGETQVVDVETGVHLSTISMEYPLGLRWSPDSTLLVAGFLEIVEPGTVGIIVGASSPILALVRVWEVETGSLLNEYSGMPAVPQIFRWGRETHELIGSAPRGFIYVWDLETDVLKTIVGLGSLGPIDYSPYSGRLIVGGKILGQDGYKPSMFSELPWSQVPVPNILEVTVPVATLERFAEIATSCNAPSNLTQFDTGQSEAQIAITLETALNELSENTIPLGCKLDLLAIAQTVIAENPLPPPTPTPAPSIYRAVQEGARVHIERAMSAGIDILDSPPVGDGWTFIGRTNGAGDNGTLMSFKVVNDVPYAAIQHYNKGCIVVTPRSLEPRRQGQTRLVTIVQQGIPAPCEGNWQGFTP